jgi:predicted secreted protein
MAVSIGVDLIVKKGTTAVGGQRNATLTVDIDPIEIQDKNSADANKIIWRTLAEKGGNGSWEVKCDGLITTGTGGSTSLIADVIAGSMVELEMTLAGSETGDLIEGSAKAIHYEATGGDKDASSSCTFRGSGALTYTPPAAG